MTLALSPITLRDPLDAPRHLGGGPAREGHQQDFAGIGAFDDQVSHPVRQGVGLAGPRAGNDEEWHARHRMVLPHAMLDSPPLFRIELFEISDGHCCESVWRGIHGTTLLVLFATRLP
jgi:hypothetical protein